MDQAVEIGQTVLPGDPDAEAPAVESLLRCFSSYLLATKPPGNDHSENHVQPAEARRQKGRAPRERAKQRNRAQRA